MHSPPSIIDIQTATTMQWDAIIIGSGMGGSTVAFELARNNKKVLILEKGLAKFSLFRGVKKEREVPEDRLQSGKWPSKLTAIIDNRKSEFWGPLGCGAGGSSSLYAAALQRFEPTDFEEKILPSGEKIRWPYSYQELAPYYERAEALFSVCGTPNPLHAENDTSLLPPPPMCETDRNLFANFKKLGLNPFRLHVGIKYENGCMECGGHICKKACKQDANNACLKPALETGNAYFMERAEVNLLHEENGTISSVELTTEQKNTTLTASVFILAAGAYFTPVLLQKSRNENWPYGLANNSDMVGRNLMFHAGHLLALWTKQRYSRDGAKKTIALRDFYTFQGTKYGELQSTGLTAEYGNVVYALGLMFDQSIFRNFKLLKHLLRIPAYLATKLYGNASIFATIVEDYPYKENRVIADSSAQSGMRFEYHRHQELINRTIGFKKIVCKKLKSLRAMAISGMNLNYGHPCGTCRAGSDPSNSVLDSNGKAHGLDNLYIADASFMPTSGGTNPSLTIAAHALRVANKINRDIEKLYS